MVAPLGKVPLACCKWWCALTNAPVESCPVKLGARASGDLNSSSSSFLLSFIYCFMHATPGGTFSRMISHTHCHAQHQCICTSILFLRIYQVVASQYGDTDDLSTYSAATL